MIQSGVRLKAALDPTGPVGGADQQRLQLRQVSQLDIVRRRLCGSAPRSCRGGCRRCRSARRLRSRPSSGAGCCRPSCRAAGARSASGRSCTCGTAIGPSPASEHHVGRIDRLDRFVEGVDQRPGRGRRRRPSPSNWGLKKRLRLGSLRPCQYRTSGQSGEAAAVPPSRGRREGRQRRRVRVADARPRKRRRLTSLHPGRSPVDLQNRFEAGLDGVGHRAIGHAPVVAGVRGIVGMPVGGRMLGRDGRPFERDAHEPCTGCTSALEGQRGVVPRVGDAGDKRTAACRGGRRSGPRRGAEG